MAKLTAAQRKKLSSSSYGLPGKKAYPMPDRAHAANAKARAAQQEKKGNLTASQRKQVDAKANKVLRRGKR